ncbi:MAG: hypothetical protein DRQ55_06275 [Planctomycetota bacterium]|nr:MAG: hypothetical protein DRQ55_06275 [Planctomycetota bacterium]
MTTTQQPSRHAGAATPPALSGLAACAARLQRSTLAAVIDLPDAFDPLDDQHLNRVAGGLLRRFREQDDVEAYSFLVELLHARLLSMAAGIVRRQGLLVDPDDLVAGFMARIFSDVRKDQPVVRQFLALAYTAMRYDALNQLRLHRRARTRGEAWEAMRAARLAPIDPAWAVERDESSARTLRMAATFLAVVDQSFHRLREHDRRVLTLRELDGLSYDDLAAALDVPRTQVGMVLKRARARLARDVQTILERTPPPAPVHRQTALASLPP